jgi:hypothetical protein
MPPRRSRRALSWGLLVLAGLAVAVALLLAVAFGAI